MTDLFLSPGSVQCVTFTPDCSRFISPGGFVSGHPSLAVGLFNLSPNSYRQQNKLITFWAQRMCFCVQQCVFVGHLCPLDTFGCFITRGPIISVTDKCISHQKT